MDETMTVTAVTELTEETTAASETSAVGLDDVVSAFLDENQSAASGTLAPEAQQMAERSNDLFNSIIHGNVNRNVIADFLEGFLNYLPTIIIAAIVFFVFKWLSSLLLKFTKKALQKIKFSKYGQDFILHSMNVLLKIFNVCIVLTILGLPVISILILVVTVAIAGSVAVSDEMKSLFAGLVLMFTKPFEKGDYIKFGEYEGIAGKIGIVHTEVISLDDKVIIIPNEKIVSEVLVNYNRDGVSCVQYKFGISYGSDHKRAEEIIRRAMAEHPLVLHERDNFARMTALEDSAVIITMRAWTAPENYWKVHCDLLEEIKKSFDETGIVIPFPQVTVSYLGEKGGRTEISSKGEMQLATPGDT